jgi:hypothetical protein
MATIDTLCSRYPPWRSRRNSGPAVHPLINSHKTGDYGVLQQLARRYRDREGVRRTVEKRLTLPQTRSRLSEQFDATIIGMSPPYLDDELRPLR